MRKVSFSWQTYIEIVSSTIVFLGIRLQVTGKDLLSFTLKGSFDNFAELAEQAVDLRWFADLAEQAVQLAQAVAL